jgi:hypothetical protein
VKIIDILNQVYEDIWEIFKSKWRDEEELNRDGYFDKMLVILCGFGDSQRPED